MNNIVDITDRIPKVASWEEVERKAEAELAYEDAIEHQEIDLAQVAERVGVVVGSLSSLAYLIEEQNAVSGPEFWAVCESRASRRVYIAQLRDTYAMLGGIIAAFEELPADEKPEEWRPSDVLKRAEDKP